MTSASPPGTARTGDVRLVLYIAGHSPAARRALENRNRLLAALGGDAGIEIIDILADPGAAERASILATPTLSDETHDPPRRLIGDIGNIDQVLDYFGFSRRDSQ